MSSSTCSFQPLPNDPLWTYYFVVNVNMIKAATSAEEAQWNSDIRPNEMLEPSRSDILRYRFHHGTNLGGCFVLEKWLTPSLFPQGADTSELAGVTASINQYGKAVTQQKLEAHWENFVTDQDLDWLANIARCTTIRLPIGYWTLGRTFCKNTPFAEVSGIYANAWAAVKKIVWRANERGIGTLIDFHGLPGGANSDDHSGTNSGRADLWENDAYLSLATTCITFIGSQIKKMHGVVGLQVVNEAQRNALNLYSWYDHVLTQMSKIDTTIPIYISDAWDLHRAIEYCRTKNRVGGVATNPVVVDTHKYWLFSDAEKERSPREIIAEVPDCLSILHGNPSVVDDGAGQVIVGEYCCALSTESWTKSPKEERQELSKELGQVQTKAWQKCAGGSYFWTFKMDWMDGGEWGFKEQINAEAILPPEYLTFSRNEVERLVEKVERVRDVMGTASFEAHKMYWTLNAPQTNFEHWRYRAGWETGFEDALAFYTGRANGFLGLNINWGADRIGCLDLWVRKRILDSCMAGQFVWEFEQGLRQGIDNFHTAIELPDVY